MGNASFLLMTTIHLRDSEYANNCSYQGLQVFIRGIILYMPILEIKYVKVIFTNWGLKNGLQKFKA